MIRFLHRRATLLAAPLLLLFAFSACKKDAENYAPNCSGTKSFATDVSPIIQSSCAVSSGCHGSGSTSGPGHLSTYQQVFNARTNIRAAVASGRMPQGGALTNAQKDALLCWIDAGAPNN